MGWLGWVDGRDIGGGGRGREGNMIRDKGLKL